MGPSSTETLTHEEFWALAGEYYLDYTKANRAEPGTAWDREAALKLHERKDHRRLDGLRETREHRTKT